MISVIVDRLEGEFAVVELPDRTFVNMSRILLPEGVVEGDVLNISINRQATRQRKEDIRSLLDEIRE